MPQTDNCHDHSESAWTYLCSHLSEDAAGLGFNRAEPNDEDPFPDAWCDDCDLILEAHGGWTDESEKLVETRCVCPACYHWARIRNTRTDVSLEDLSSLRWQCGDCDEWHTGPCLDFGYSRPFYWSDELDKVNQIDLFTYGNLTQATNLLDENICVVNGTDYFIHGRIALRIIGTDDSFFWDIWGSLSKDNFEKLMLMNDDPRRVELPPMFSWLSSQIQMYPDTLSLKMRAHIQELGEWPLFELELTDHPLSQEFYYGITPKRVKEIMQRLDLTN